MACCCFNQSKSQFDLLLQQVAAQKKSWGWPLMMRPGPWAGPPLALADPCQPSCSVMQLARWSHNRPCTRTLPRHKAFEDLLSEKCLIARPGLPGLCPLTWLWSVLSAQRGMTDRSARQPCAGRWVEGSVGLVKLMGGRRRETEDGYSTAEPSSPLSLRKQKSSLACDVPGWAVSVGMENILHTSTDYCNTSSPNPEGHMQSVLPMPSESKLKMGSSNCILGSP